MLNTSDYNVSITPKNLIFSFPNFSHKDFGKSPGAHCADWGVVSVRSKLILTFACRVVSGNGTQRHRAIKNPD